MAVCYWLYCRWQVFALTGLIFLAAALSAVLLRYSHERQSELPSIEALRADYRALASALLGPQRRVLTAICANALGVLGVGGVLSLLLPAMVKSRFSDGPETLGLLMGLIALGTVGGAYSTAYVFEGRREGSMYLAWAAYGALLVSFGLALPLSVALGVGLVLGFVGAVADVMFATIVQTAMPSRHISKSFALFSTMANVGEALSAPLLAAMLSGFGMMAAFSVGGGLAVMVGLFGLWATRSRPQAEFHR